MRIVIAGGGTAGHVNPAIALARALEADDVTFIGTERGAEGSLVPAAGFALERISVRGFDRSKPAGIFGVAMRASAAVVEARRILKRIAPDVVVGMGGYVALPVCMAARARRLPVVVHEQNIVLGLTNRICKRFAQRVAVSFEDTITTAGSWGVYVGNLVLPEIAKLDRQLERKQALVRYELDADRKTLLLFGGSQGARRINEAAPGLVREWKSKKDRQILHVVGSQQTAESRAEGGSGTGGLVYRVVGFEDRMACAYSIADLAVCRGGASTVAELGAVGLPALIVPYPYHRDRQQEKHGRALEEAGAAIVIPDAEATPARVAKEAEELFADESRLRRMRAAALSFGRPDAAQRLAEVVREAAA